MVKYISYYYHVPFNLPRELKEPYKLLSGKHTKVPTYFVWILEKTWCVPFTKRYIGSALNALNSIFNLFFWVWFVHTHICTTD